MIYFTYKLKMVEGSGFSPQKDCSETWLSCGHFLLPNGTLLGYSTKSSLAETFTAEQIADHEIVEITDQQARARAASTGFNDPILDGNGFIIDNNPPYLEKRGWNYIAGLGGVQP